MWPPAAPGFTFPLKTFQISGPPHLVNLIKLSQVFFSESLYICIVDQHPAGSPSGLPGFRADADEGRSRVDRHKPHQSIHHPSIAIFKLKFNQHLSND